MSTCDWDSSAPYVVEIPDRTKEVQLAEQCLDLVDALQKSNQECIGLRHELAMSRMKVSALLESRLRAAFVGRS